MITPLDVLSLETWILIICLLGLIRLYIHQKWQFLKKINVPHEPPTILGLGHMMSFLKDQDVIFSRDVELKQKFGPIFGGYAWLSPSICVGDPEILKHIFIKEFSVFPDRQKQLMKISGKEMNSSLLNTSGEQWKRIRNTLTPTFSSSKLKQMFGIIEQCADQTVKTLMRVSNENDGRFEVKERFGRYSLDVICAAAFSADVKSQEGDQKPKIVEMAQKASDVSFSANLPLILLVLFPWMESFFVKCGYSIYPKYLLEYYHGLTDALIAKKNDPTLKQRVDLMQLMLNAEISEEDVKRGQTKGITRNEIIGNSIIMILAGYETTANAMTFLAYNLATHKDVQRRVQQEIEDTVEEYGSLTYEGVNNMKYLEMCINESLRLYTPVAKNARCAEKDITINGVKIPKGIGVQIPVYGMCHDEEYFDEPFKFKPERMEDMSKIDQMTFLPFGAGPRNCIGMRLAVLEIKIGFCKLLQEFDLDVCDDTPPPPLAMTFKSSMRPKEKVFLQVVPRACG